MLLSSVIIILREVLETVLLMSIFLALSYRLGTGRRWVFIAIGFGCMLAYAYASAFDWVAAWYDGAGQEVVNATLQLSIYLCIVFFCVSVARHHQQPQAKCLNRLMILGVSLAICREGSEIVLYLTSFMQTDALRQSALLGGMMGACIGLSIGILLYYILISFPASVQFKVGFTMVILISAGLVSQATRLLIQIDWLPSQNMLWDTSVWLSESSVSGQLLFALIGYEATPTPIELYTHLAAIGLIILSTGLAYQSPSKPS